MDDQCINTKLECQKATGKTATLGNWDWWPKGCSVKNNGRVFWNNHPTGKSHQSVKSVKKVYCMDWP